MNALRDNFSRIIDYLRISITDRCNLRCIYCMPAEGIFPACQGEILSYEEIIRVVTIAAGLGVRKVRITGGEPLTRRNIIFLISALNKIPGIEDLSLTTNGLLLEQYAEGLAAAGLNRINVSVDSFNPDTYRRITRGGELSAVLKGLRAAGQAGLTPVKINMVPIRGINENEVVDFAKLTLESDSHVRFIEFMPSGNHGAWGPDKYVSTDELKRMIGTIAPITPVRMRKDGPSRYYRLKGAKGVVGFISALTHHFCEDCNRLRMTSDGKLRPCLFSETEIDLKYPIRNGAPDAEIERLLRLSIGVKPRGHNIGKAGEALLVGGNSSGVVYKRPMSKIGG